jgi:hypothetical protein
MQGEGLGRGGDSLNHRVSLDHGPRQRATGIVFLYNEFSQSSSSVQYSIHNTHAQALFFSPRI